MSVNRKFRYTKSNKALTDDQRAFYEENGYVVIKNNVPHNFLDELKQYFIEICEGEKQAGLVLMKDRSLKERGYTGEKVVNKIQDFLFDDTFFKYATYGPVTDVVESIIGPNLVGVHSMLINKPPDSNPELSRHPLHQDLYYFPFRPINSIVASWTAMEYVNEQNGCLYCIPGSHRREQLYPHTYPEGLKNTLYHGVSGFDDEVKLNLVMEKGDTVFFHPLLLHGSGPNFTNGFRKAISVHFADSNCYFIDVNGTVQENVAKESEAVVSLEYSIIWKMKSRYIKGEIGSFKNVPSNL